MSRLRPNARTWAIRKMRVSMGGSRSVATAAWKAASHTAVRLESEPYRWADYPHGGFGFPTRRVWFSYTEGLKFLHGGFEVPTRRV